MWSRYRETLPILYGENEFLICQITCLTQLPKLLPSVAIHSLQRLCFSTAVSQLPMSMGGDEKARTHRAGRGQQQEMLDSKNWQEVWQTLAGFPNLKHLTVEIGCTPQHRYLWSSREAEVFRNICGVAPEDFVMQLDWPEGPIPMDDLPFKIRRRSPT